jgi:hypothetical protein
MVTVKKKSGKVRICINPKDLNEVIMRERYPLPTLENVATGLSKARVYSVLDVETGFWQVKLESDSSSLTIFNTPIGRYRCTRMAFGIFSALLIWQRHKNEMIEDYRELKSKQMTFWKMGLETVMKELWQTMTRI